MAKESSHHYSWLCLTFALGLLALCNAPTGAANPEMICQNHSTNQNTGSFTVDPMSYQHSVNSYLERVKHKLLGIWCPPPTEQQTVSVLSFKVNRQGTIFDIALTKSSGDKFIDDLALSTVESASPLDPLPAGAPETLTIDFSFARQSAERAPEDTLESKKQATETHPNDPKVFYEYGRALRFAGHPQAALAPLKHALDLGYVGCEPFIDLSLSYKKLGQWAQAKQALEQAEARNANFSPAVKTMADLLFEQKLYEQSAAYYQKFLKMQPEGPLSEFCLLRLEKCRNSNQEDGE